MHVSPFHPRRSATRPPGFLTAGVCLLATIVGALGGGVFGERACVLAGTAPDAARIPVIVTLETPREEPEALHRQTGREETVARAVDAFLLRARPLGLEPAAVLVHLPVVVATVPADRLAALATLPGVASLERDRRLELHRLEGGALVGSDALRTARGADGAGVAVAVVDSGVDTDHPELAGRVVDLGDVVTPGDSDALRDPVGHGTAVAGIVAGAEGGMAPAATVGSLRAVAADGFTSLSLLLAALDRILDRQGEVDLDIDIVNLSLGSGSHATACDDLYPSTALAVDLLAEAGILVVASSGNDGDKAGIAFPACLETVFAVGAVYDTTLGPLDFEVCEDLFPRPDAVTCFSGSAPPLDALAPSFCATTSRAGGGTVRCFGGTSSAAAYASGVAAQLASLAPDVAPELLAEALATTGRPRTDSNDLTRRRLDAVAAAGRLEELLADPGDDPPPIDAPWLTTDEIPGFRFRVVITPPGGEPVAGAAEPCIAETLCVSGALTGRSEVFVRLPGPRPNGFLWPTLVRFTPSRVEVWIEQLATGAVRRYELEGADPDDGSLSGAVDRRGFRP